MTMPGSLVPRIRLRLIFFIFFCAAFGLAIGSAPVSKDDPLFTIWGWRNARLNWHYALLAAGTVPVVIGLLKEAAILKNWSGPAGTERITATFAQTFAVAWRIAIAGFLVICLVTVMVVSRQLVSLPESELLLSYAVFPNAIWVVCLVIVLSVSLSRWRCEPLIRETPWKLVTVWLMGATLAALILPDIGLIHFLVHVATAGIEFAQPASFQFADGFPDHRAEGYRSFWISMAAVGAIVAAIPNLVALVRVTNFRRSGALIGAGTLCVLLIMAAAYCVWYYSFELARVSPFLAEVGLGSYALEWCAGIALAAILITAGAHRAAASEDSHYVVVSGISDEAERLPLYESIGCLLVFVAAVAVYIFEAIRTYVNFSRIFTASYVAEAIVGLLRDPGQSSCSPCSR